MNRFIRWCGSNTATAKCTRTIAQGVIGVVIAYLADMLAQFNLDPTMCAMITALVMAVLSPVQAAIGNVDGWEEGTE